ncbi:MAG: hypothetical protein HY811_00240 [Planctomycetes bacterium]|nr:hypothetical protein [Planctomycetota bacterium]
MKSFICILCVFAVIFFSGCSKPDGGLNNRTPTRTVGAETPNPVNPLNPVVVIDEMKKELGKDYIVDYIEPFAVAGNISQREFDRFKKGTIKGCSEAMYKDYFDKKPDYILKVYLFEGASSYEAYVKKTEGREPSTPYGYYMDSSKSLIMNIGTGGGTLVHEMFHALVAPDFPDIPAWYNEGMGSLYEQCTVTDDGSLKGMINWRYPILMEAYNNNKLVPLTELFKTTDYEFYDKDKGTNYAQARYFCLYMQEQGILPKFYKKFRDNYDADKTGTKFVEELLGKKIDEIDTDWQKWVPTVKEIEHLK